MNSDNKRKLIRDVLPEHFTLPLVLVDILPVLLFTGSCLRIAFLFHNSLFLAGAVLCFWAGTAKVLWKIIVIKKKQNVWWLFLQMRIAMPAGFALMALSVLLSAEKIDFPSLFASVLSFPSVLFFSLGIAGMALMGLFAAKLDAGDLRSNWIEQLTNTAAQLFILLGILTVR